MFRFLTTAFALAAVFLLGAVDGFRGGLAPPPGRVLQRRSSLMMAGSAGGAPFSDEVYDAMKNVLKIVSSRVKQGFLLRSDFETLEDSVNTIVADAETESLGRAPSAPVHLSSVGAPAPPAAPPAYR